MTEMGNEALNIWIIVLLMTMAHALENVDPAPDNASRFKLSVGPEQAHKNQQNLHKMNKDSSGSSELSSEEESAVQHDITLNYPSSLSSQVSSFRLPREQQEIPRPYRLKKERKVRLGQYAGKHISRKNKNWKLWPEYVKSPIDPSDSNIAWSYWETDEEEPDDADDSKHPTTTTTTTTTTEAPTTTTTTTTTPAPMMTMKDQTPPVSIHKHFHYFKKAAPWAGDAWKGDKETTTAPPTPPMTMEDMMKMTDDMMEEIMMKGMMMMPPHPEPDTKKGGGISGIFKKLSKVEPITILVAGIIPASLILAAALPSVMNKMMAMKGDTNASPMVPMITTTAVSNEPMDMMGSRSANGPHSITEILEAVGDFGLKAMEKPQCAKKMFCKLANEKLMTDSPVMKRAVHLAAIAMEDSWLQHVGVQSIFKSLNDGTCNQVDCESVPRNGDSLTT